MMNFVFGEYFQKSQISPDDALVILEKANQRKKEFAEVPLDAIYLVLDRLQERWSDPNYERRIRLQKILPHELNFSSEMVDLGLSRVALILNSEVLHKKVETELGSIPRHSEFKIQAQSATALKWEPLGTLFHVLAGNGFLGALSSLLEGLLTSNINILKLAQGKSSFMAEFIESLEEVDSDGVIYKNIAVVQVPSSDKETLNVFKKNADGIVVWGGEAAIQAYRHDLPARTRLIGFGPKLSFAYVSRLGLSNMGTTSAADALALEISTWDQSACTAPQFCYVEGLEGARSFLKELEKSMLRMNNELPPGPASEAAASEIQKWRGLALVEESLDQGQLRASTDDLSYSLILSHDKQPLPSPLHRTIRVIPVEGPQDVVAEISDISGYLQTLGLYSCSSEFAELSLLFSKAGVLRVLELGKMSFGEVDDPHDGAYDLPQFMKLCHYRMNPANRELSINDTIPPQQLKETIEYKLKTMNLKKSHYPELKRRLESYSLNSLDDLKKVPPQKDFEFNFDCARDGYVARSGGTTGEPKYSIYSEKEWQRLIDRSIQVFLASGIVKGDRIANCLSAGDLYGGFVSFDHINQHMGTLQFNFSSNASVDSFVSTWKKFRFNVIQGIPSYILPFLEKVKEVCPEFEFEKFLFGGTTLNAGARKLLKDQFNVRRFSAIYGANDGGPIGYQCQSLEGNLYHVLDDYNYIELLDDHGHDVSPGQIGNLHLTALEKYSYPLIRYPLGDRAREVLAKCSCGRSARTIEWLGRETDFFEVRGKVFSAHEFETLLTPLESLEYQVKILTQSIQFLVEVESKRFDKPLIDSVREQLRSHLGLVESGQEQTFNVEIKLFSPGEIPRKTRSTKLEKLIVSAGESE